MIMYCKIPVCKWVLMSITPGRDIIPARSPLPLPCIILNSRRPPVFSVSRYIIFGYIIMRWVLGFILRDARRIDIFSSSKHSHCLCNNNISVDL